MLLLESSQVEASAAVYIYFLVDTVRHCSGWDEVDVRGPHCYTMLCTHSLTDIGNILHTIRRTSTDGKKTVGQDQQSINHALRSIMKTATLFRIITHPASHHSVGQYPTGTSDQRHRRQSTNPSTHVPSDHFASPRFASAPSFRTAHTRLSTRIAAAAPTAPDVPSLPSSRSPQGGVRMHRLARS